MAPGTDRPFAIEIDGVSRIYQKYSARHRFKTFKSALVSGSFFKSLRPDELVTALDDIGFNVPVGTTYGVIGENGSGKSTLLKIVAGIAKPTSGRLAVHGKVSALIELGAGFHPEISGRENVFINGIMLGLSKKEIAAKFDEIVRFAELEPFIDAPVKTYSSGMYMRLGFSVAINVNPDILLVDEVLAVGDAAFVPKCLDRIDDFRRRKKTILFVSHDLATVEKICDKVVWLKNGRVMTIGEPKRIVDAYLQDVAEKQEQAFERDREVRTRRSEEAQRARDSRAAEAAMSADGGEEAGIGVGTGVGGEEERENRWGKREVEIRKVTLRNAAGLEKHVFAPEEGMTIELEVESYSRIKDFVFGVGIFNSQGIACYGTNTHLEDFTPRMIYGEGRVVFRVDRLNLVNGTYYLDVAVHKRDGYPYDYHRNLYTLLVSSQLKDVGIARLPHAWEFSPAIAIEPPEPRGAAAPAGAAGADAPDAGEPDAAVGDDSAGGAGAADEGADKDRAAG